MFSKFFGKEKSTTSKRNVVDLAGGLTAPAVHIVHSQEPTRSHLGGKPTVTAKFSWPAKNGNQLEFLAQIDLVDLQSALRIPWLPDTGALLFFYDLEQQAWGFDPKDRGSWSVLHVQRRAPPNVFKPDIAKSENIPCSTISFRQIDSLPDSQRQQVAALQLTDAEWDDWYELSRYQFGRMAKHQIGGFPDPVQDDGMELECQLVSNGLYCGDPSGYHDPKVERLASGTDDWKLLLQFDSDDDLNVMWGDLGKLYFWIREQDGRARKFTDVWMILQCG